MKTMRLDKLNKNQIGIICVIDGDVFIKRRLLELGFVNGTEVKVLSVSPLKNTYLLRLKDYCLALRKNSLELISVVVNEWANFGAGGQPKHRQNNTV